jgi:hypothetical protein
MSPVWIRSQHHAGRSYLKINDHPEFICELNDVERYFVVKPAVNGPVRYCSAGRTTTEKG